MSDSQVEAPVDRDIEDLHQFGYRQALRRTIGSYTSFAVGFTMMSITTALFTAFAVPFVNMGGVAIWLWIPVTLGVMPIVLVYCHLSARMPVTGYAYQWSARLVSSDFGWFVGWAALLSFVAGTAGVATTMANVFGPEIWDDPSRGQLQLFTGVFIVLAVIINMVGVRIATRVNNAGATAELVGTLGIGLVVAVGLFFFADSQGVDVLFSTTRTEGSGITLELFGLAALLPIFTLIGWEGSADLAEETRDPRRTAPVAMIRSVLISAVAGFLLFAVFAMAIPHGVVDTFSQDKSPLIYIVDEQLGGAFATLFKLVAFISILSALLANVAVATRLIFSLTRDNMLPASKSLSVVSDATRTPMRIILLVGVLALGINLLSEGLLTRVISIVSACYYLTYLLTLGGVIYAISKARIPDAPGYFDLGRWLKPLCWIGIAFTLAGIAFLTIPKVNNIAAGGTAVAFVVAGLWYLVVLRGRLARGEAGAALHSLETAETADEHAIAHESVAG